MRGKVYQLMDNFTLFYYRFMSDKSRGYSDSWLARSISREREVWNGLAFERVCLEHLSQIKTALGIAGVRTEAYSWRRHGEDGAQIDLLISRADNVVNICEMKYSHGQYEITAEEMDKMFHRRSAYIEDMNFGGSAFLTFVTPRGVKRNVYWNDIQSEVTLDDLFKD